MGPFHLESIAAGGDRAVLRIDGDIDACTAPQLRERVIDLAGNGTVHVIADLRGVGFLDSAGLGALVAARKELRGRAGSLMRPWWQRYIPYRRDNGTWLNAAGDQRWL
jgi:anti-anti-sigma factor